jgi:hypothetical protein
MKPEAPTSRLTLHGWSDYGFPIVHVSAVSERTPDPAKALCCALFRELRGVLA